MRRWEWVCAAVAAGLMWGGGPRPAIRSGGVFNAASRMPVGLAAGAIEPGAQFVIRGRALGPESAAAAPEERPDAGLGGTAVEIIQEGRAWRAALVRVERDRVVAVMPEAAPGEASVVVRREGQASAPEKIRVGGGAFGIFAVGGKGWGAAEGVTGPARRGGVVTLRGTGLEAGESGLRVVVGGVAARVEGVERVCCSGVERVRFRVPGKAPVGCSVPVQVVRANGAVSNTVTIAVAGRAGCGEPWLAGAAKEGGAVGLALLIRLRLESVVGGKKTEYDEDSASVALRRVARRTGEEAPFSLLPAEGTCMTVAGPFTAATLLALRGFSGAVLGGKALDAGPEIELAGEAGRVVVERTNRGEPGYSAVLGGRPLFRRDTGRPLFLRPGMYRMTAAGGADVGAFEARIPAGAEMVWENREELDRVDRKAGVMVRWRGAGKKDIVLVVAGSADIASGAAGACICRARPGVGSFLVPAYALSNIPDGIAVGLPLSVLGLLDVPAKPSNFAARGLDRGYGVTLTLTARTVEFH